MGYFDQECHKLGGQGSSGDLRGLGTSRCFYKGQMAIYQRCNGDVTCPHTHHLVDNFRPFEQACKDVGGEVAPHIGNGYCFYKGQVAVSGVPECVDHKKCNDFRKVCEDQYHGKWNNYLMNGGACFFPGRYIWRVAAHCYQADTRHYPNCYDYIGAGYTCVGTQCAAINPTGDPKTCAKIAPAGFVVNPRTGKCVRGNVNNRGVGPAVYRPGG